MAEVPLALVFCGVLPDSQDAKEVRQRQQPTRQGVHPRRKSPGSEQEGDAITGHTLFEAPGDVRRD